MGLTGDFEALSKLAAGISRIEKLPEETAQAATARIQKLIDEEFAKFADPYGRPWPAFSKRTGSDKHRDIPASIKTTAKGGTIEVEASNPHSHFYQFGTSRMPARPFLPIGGLPDSWEKAIEDSANEAVTKLGVK